MKGIIDRFEDDIVVIEVDGSVHDIRRELVETDVQEGDIVYLTDGLWTKNEAETNERTKHIKSLMDDVWAD